MDPRGRHFYTGQCAGPLLYRPRRVDLPITSEEFVGEKAGSSCGEIMRAVTSQLSAGVGQS